MASSFGLEGPSSIPDVAKDPPSKCGVLARKIRDSESRWQFTMGVVSGKNSLPFRDISKLRRWTMDGAAIYRIMSRNQTSAIEK